MKKFILLITSFVISSFILQAQWSNNAAVNNVICNITGDQAIPKVACCTNGDTYIAYFSSEGGNYNIRLQRLDVMGNILWTNNGILISNNPSMTWLTDWDMTTDLSGNCIMALMDIRNGNNNIYGYCISPDGSFTWGLNGITLSNNMAFNASPKVTATIEGNAIFAWHADSVILMQKISPTGTFIWGAAGKTFAPEGASGTHGYSWPQLIHVGADDFLMKYFEDTGSGLYPIRNIWVQRFDATGTGIWSSPASVTKAGGIASFTQLLSFINDNNDGCYVAWHDDRDGDLKSNSWVQHVNSSGIVTFGTNGTEVCNNNANNHFYPQAVVPAGSTDVYVYWNEMNSLQTLWGIYGQRISSIGTLEWGTSGNPLIPVSTVDVYPLVARSCAPDMVVFYEQYVDASSQLLKAMRINPSGTFVWAGNSVTISSVVSSKVHEEITEMNNNQWIVAWEDNRTGDIDIYAQNLKPAGDLGPIGPQTYGNIEGQVTVTGGTASVTSVTVTAGTFFTHPDATGHYTLANVLTGTYTVMAVLSGYTNGTMNDVVVLESQTTSNIDLTLDYIPVNGHITGTVTLNGGSGNVTQAMITAGSSTTNPNVSGVYSLEVPSGNYTVNATLSGYLSGVIDDVNVMDGQTTSDVNFVLNPIVGISDIKEPIMLKVIPDPTGINGKIMFTVSASGYYVLELFDPVGQCIANLPRYFIAGTTDLPLLNFSLTAPGLYYLKISGKGKEMGCRFVFTGR